jgi:hypothetical protein
MLEQYALSILSVPLADKALTALLVDKDCASHAQILRNWVDNVGPRKSTLRVRVSAEDSFVSLRLEQPTKGHIGIRLVSQDELLRTSGDLLKKAASEMKRCSCDLLILGFCADETRADVLAALEELKVARDNTPSIMLMEPAWCAAILIEQIRPLADSTESSSPAFSDPAYFAPSADLSGSTVSVQRASIRLRTLRTTRNCEGRTFSAPTFGAAFHVFAIAKR